jgi:pilus assembly protein CpaB
LFVSRNPGAGIPSARTRVILQNIRIFAVDQTVQRAADGGEGRAVAKTVSLLLTPGQANKIALAEQVGELNLIPRSPDDEALTDDTEWSMDDLFVDRDSKNSRKREQYKNPEPQEAAGGGFLSGLMAQVKKAAEEKPPFVMTILEAEQVREVEFDPFTGKPIRDTGANRRGAAAMPVPATPASAQQPASPATSEAEAELEEDFGASFPIDFE